MHPMVKPALRRGWRDLSTAQFGMTPAHALALGPLDGATGSFLGLLNGTRGTDLLREEGRRMDLPEGHVDRLLERLTRAGLLDDARGGGPAADALRERGEVLDRLRPDLASLSLTTTGPGDAIDRLAARASLRVRVRGAGRVGTLLASVLAGAGVGEVDVRDGGCVEPWDVAPGGLPAEAVGDRRDEAARRAVRRAAPARPPRRSTATPPEDDGPGFSLVVLSPRDDVAVHAPDPLGATSLMASGTPHLYAGVVEGTGVVGPLVLPGETGCAGCLQADRAERDPLWPRLVAQWRSGGQQQVRACDLALATTVAGLAAAHALAFLDGRTPSGAGARWEAALPALQWRTRPVPGHPACPCGAAGASRATGENGTATGEFRPSEGLDVGATGHGRGPVGKGKREHTSVEGGERETMTEHWPSARVRRVARTARPAGTWRAHV